MAAQPLTVLVIGATGSIGRLVVAEAIARGHTVRALVR
ncbi:NmrA family NAD(P)-binding protein [Streptomyces sp. NPDC048384]